MIILKPTRKLGRDECLSFKSPSIQVAIPIVFYGTEGRFSGAVTLPTYSMT